MAAASLVYILGASLFFIANHWQGIRSGQLSFDQGVKGVANEVLDNQITSDLTSIYTERFEQAVRLPQRYISARRVSSRTGDFEVSTSQFFRYLGEIRGQESIVRDLAIEQTRECKSGDRGCEIYHLLHYVSEEVKYVSDPRGPYDNIQPPQETTRLAAGDCEDQTILLISMLEAVGIDALIVFTEGHAYPMACIAEQIQSRRWLAREPNIYQFDRAETPYCYPLEPTDPKAQVGYNYEYEDFIYAVDPVTDIHYEFKAAAG
jgi:hypothetical protein